MEKTVLCLGLCYIFAAVTVQAQTVAPQKVRTVSYPQVKENWEDYRHWDYFVNFSDWQNRKAADIMKEDLREKAGKLEEEFKDGIVTKKDYDIGLAYAQQRARDLLAFGKIQEEITEYRVRHGTSERNARISEKIPVIAEKGGIDFVVRVQDDVLFADPAISVSKTVAETLNQDDRELEKELMEREGPTEGPWKE